MEALNSSLQLLNNISEIVNSTALLSPTEKDARKTHHFYDMKRYIYITTLPIIIIFGTIGNILSFIVMQRGSLKDVSVCFYMSILALADTGE